MSDSIEEKCISKGIKLTDQRKVIAKVMSESKETYGEADHPDVDELYNRVSKIDAKILQNRLHNHQKIDVGSLCKACPSTSRSLKAPRIHFRTLGSPKWSQHGAKRAPKMEPKSMPKSISSRRGVSGGLGRASGSYKPPFGDHCRPISVPNRLPAPLWSPFGTDLGAIWPLF